MKKILITLAGSSGTISILNSMRNRNDFIFIGIAIDKFKAAKSNTDKTYLLSPYTKSESEYIKDLGRLIKKQAPDFLIINSEAEALIVSKHQKEIPVPILLPSYDEIKVCDDKLLFHRFCDDNNIRNAKTFQVLGLSDISRIFRELGSLPLWCRMRQGNSSRGATKINTVQQASFWIDYWNKMRDTPIDQFLISEFLPGRDFAVQSIWKKGKLYVMKAAERLSYFGGYERISGVSSTPEVAVTINNPVIFEFCINLINLISNGKANGCYNIDLKLNAKGEICVTEINAGRFYNITAIFNASGKIGTFDTFVALGLNQEDNLSINTPFDYEEKYLCRDIDTLPDIVSKSDLEKKISIL